MMPIDLSRAPRRPARKTNGFQCAAARARLGHVRRCRRDGLLDVDVMPPGAGHHPREASCSSIGWLALPTAKRVGRLNV
ncbi:hypothetical protein GUJ93_ZPchr0001g31736 [Zizania palustris]|uniref:Uncharacterized protein n=1 Tax=Zizania palustris TaxID=103762 RepID=A0A8J5RWI9_ZIZPA|nr:hypothetical protein GUJ93_ZPchr0001g31736 [Zizania palustris]